MNLCARCGVAGRPGDRWCVACGASLARGGDDPADRHAPGMRHTLAGERKVVTVLFADIVDSTAMIQDVDPELAVARLQPGLDAMTRAVHEYGGIVSSVAGDGILALFGAPAAHEDHAVRACVAALSMLDAVTGADVGGVRIRVGAHSGEVLLRTVGTDLSRDYTAIGPTVHIASRMERMAEPGEALVTGGTARLVGGHVRTDALGTRRVRGLDRPVEVHRLRGRTAVVGTWAPRATRGLTRFVGRTRELATLVGGLRRVQRGAGGVTAIVGESGVGKSRLVHEYPARVPPSVVVWRAQASPYDTSTPYYPLMTAFRELLDVRSDDESQMPDRTAAFLRELDPDLPVSAVEPLLSLMGGRPRSAAWAALDPPQRRRRIRDTVRAVVVAAARRATMIIVVEDLHWIDTQTQAVLEDLVATVADTRIHLVVTSRPGHDESWVLASRHDDIVLEPLEGDDAAALIDALVGTHPSTARLRRDLHARAGGTPLFLEEAVQALSERRVLEGRPGSYRQVGEIDDVGLPGTVQAAVGARIDRLHAADKAVLQVAAVIGESMSAAVLQAAGTDVADVARSRERLVRDGYLVASDRPGHNHVAFKHNLIREVAYAGIPRDRRRRLQAVIADVLAARRGDDAHLGRRAYHAYRAERWHDAATLLWQAAGEAEQRSAYPQARRLLLMGLDALRRLEPTNERMILAIDMAGGLRVACSGAGEGLSSTLPELERARGYAEALGDRERLAATHIQRSYVGSLTGRHVLAVDAARAVQRIGEDLGDRYLVAEGRLAEGQAMTMAGWPEGVVASLERDLDFLHHAVGDDRRGLVSNRAVTSLTFIALSHAMLGAFADADDAHARRMALSRAGGRPFELAFGAWSGGVIDLLAERFEAAERAFTDGLVIARHHDLLYPTMWIGAHLGYAEAVLGRATTSAQRRTCMPRSSSRMRRACGSCSGRCTSISPPCSRRPAVPRSRHIATSAKRCAPAWGCLRPGRDRVRRRHTQPDRRITSPAMR